ncbi:MAG: alpha/beta fold hydrolase [Pirellulaceae bacterium]
MKESVFHFGPRNSLMGILSEPDEAVRREDSPVAVLINAGIVHRVGPFRLHVDIARRLASQGVRSLRIDLSGLGDSGPRVDKLSIRERTVLDVRDCMNALESRHLGTRFALIGLCSGAFNAHKASVVDERVVGTVFIDGIAFRTPGFYLRHYGLRLMRPRFWRNMMLRRLRNQMPMSKSDRSQGEQLAEAVFFDQEIIPHEARSEINTLVRRGVQMLFIYTDGYPDIACEKQFVEMFRRRPDQQVQVEYYAKASHTFRLCANRTITVDRIAHWFSERLATSCIETA